MRDVEKQRAAKKRWAEKNREKARASQRAYAQRNPDKVKASQRAYWLRNIELDRERRRLHMRKIYAAIRASRPPKPEKEKFSFAVWRQNNRHKCNAAYKKYQANKLKATPKWANDFFIEEIYHLAQLRTKHLGVPHEVDHIVPLQSKRVCGLHCEANLRVIPASENRKKNNRRWPDMSEASTR